MATACGPVSIEFSPAASGAGDLHFMSKGRFIENWYDLRNIGASRGEDMVIAEMDGTEPYPRERGSLSVELSGIHCNGRWTLDNAVNCDTPWPQQARIYLDELLAFFDSGSKRSFTVSVTEYGTTYSGPARFEQFGSISWPLHYVAAISMRLTVPLGVLEAS